MKTPGFTLRADESMEAGAQRIADELIEAALRIARHPSRRPAEDVHFLRTTTKRLRALLQLIRPAISTAEFDRENARLKRAAARLAPFRDRAVTGPTLKALGASSAALRKVHFANGKIKTAGSRRSVIRKTASDLEESRRGFHRLRINADNRDVIGAGLTRIYKQTRRRMKVAVAHPSDEAFHQWRIRVKQLYYSVQWLKGLWPKRFRKMHKRLHEIEDSLGLDHDLVVLTTLLDASPEKVNDLDAIEQVKKTARERSRRLRKASARLGAETLRIAPRRFRKKCGQHYLSS